MNYSITILFYLFQACIDSVAVAVDGYCPVQAFHKFIFFLSEVFEAYGTIIALTDHYFYKESRDSLPYIIFVPL